MADNIHEIAKIKAGDPVGIAKQNQAEAAALLEQYKHNKEKIDEINEAIKKWKEQSKKGKGLGLVGAFGGKFLSDAILHADDLKIQTKLDKKGKFGRVLGIIVASTVIGPLSSGTVQFADEIW